MAAKETPKTPSTGSTGRSKKTPAEPAKKLTPVDLPDAEANLNASFERNRGNLPWPVSSGYLLLHHGLNKLGPVDVNSQGISIASDIGTPVKAVFDGEVTLVNNYDDLQLVVIKHGRYFTCYSNLTNVNLSKGQDVKTGQVIGRVAANLDGVGAIDLQISNDKNQDLNPEAWLKRR